MIPEPSMGPASIAHEPFNTIFPRGVSEGRGVAVALPTGVRVEVGDVVGVDVGWAVPVAVGVGVRVGDPVIVGENVGAVVGVAGGRLLTKILTLPSPAFAVTMSGRPSPSMSPMAKATGPRPSIANGTHGGLRLPFPLVS